jgi:hypothetical protein
VHILEYLAPMLMHFTKLYLKVIKTMSSPFCASVLLITKGTHGYKHCPNFASFELFWIETYTLVYIHLQLQLTRKVLDIQLVYVLFYKYSSSKCKQRICLHYGLDMVLTGEWMQSAVFARMWYRAKHVFSLARALSTIIFATIVGVTM